jgi:hypothetical protein
VADDVRHYDVFKVELDDEREIVASELVARASPTLTECWVAIEEGKHHIAMKTVGLMASSAFSNVKDQSVTKQ